MSSWIPFIPDVNEWSKHFLDSLKMQYIPNQKSYIVGQFGGTNSPASLPIEFVTPTQQAVERAKSDLKKRKKEGGPIINFTPESSVGEPSNHFTHSLNEPPKPASRRRKRKSAQMSDSQIKQTKKFKKAVRFNYVS